MHPPLTSSDLRKLRMTAQRLKATLKVGKHGLSASFLQSLDEALKHHELIKVKFDEFKDQKKALAPVLAQRTSSHLVMRVGNTAVLYRRKSETQAD